MSTTVAHDGVYFTSNGYPPLLRRPALILVQDPVDDPDERIQLGVLSPYVDGISGTILFQ